LLLRQHWRLTFLGVKMSAGKFPKHRSRLTAIALALPVAAFIPVTSPLGRDQAAQLGLPASVAALGSVGAATPKKAVRKKPATKPAATKRVCTKVKIKGKLVTRCQTVKVAPVPVVVPPPVIAAEAQPVPAPLPVAPPVNAAPPSPPPAPIAAPVIPAAAFYLIDQADSLAQALGDSPPDFTFRYDGIDCWAWVSRGGEVLIVEPGRDGVVQYYFDQGESAPYLIRDSDFAYGFDGPELVHVYDNSGRLWTAALTNRQHYDS